MDRRATLILLLIASISLVLAGYVLAQGFAPLDGFDQTERDPGNVTPGDSEEVPLEERYSFSDNLTPTNQRYINKVEEGSRPEWSLKDNYSWVGTVPESYDVHVSYEVTRYPDVSPTPENLDQAYELYRESYEVAEKRGWFEVENATSDGFTYAVNDHYINASYLLEEDSLNPSRPESLFYLTNPDDPDDRVLVAFMYMKHDWRAEGEQVAGPLTYWHFHPSARDTRHAITDAVTNQSDVGEDEFRSQFFAGEEQKYRTPEMIHVWFIEHPTGPFASMDVPDGRFERPEKMNESEFKEYAMRTFEDRFG